VKAKQSLKKFNVTLPDSKKELDLVNKQYVGELFNLYRMKQQKVKDHLNKVSKDQGMSPLQKLRKK